MKAYEISNTYVHDIYYQSTVLKLLAISFHNWHIFNYVSKIPAVSGPERQVPDRSGANQIAGFHVPDRAKIVI